MTDKVFNVAGYSKLNGQYKARFANGTVADRLRVLKRDNHQDIFLVELPRAMTKPQAAAYVLANLDTVDAAVGVALTRIAGEAGAVTKPVKGKVVVTAPAEADTAEEEVAA